MRRVGNDLEINFIYFIITNLIINFYINLIEKINKDEKNVQVINLVIMKNICDIIKVDSIEASKRYIDNNFSLEVVHIFFRVEVLSSKIL